MEDRLLRPGVSPAVRAAERDDWVDPADGDVLYCRSVDEQRTGGATARWPGGKSSPSKLYQRVVQLTAVDDAVAEPEKDVLHLAADLCDQAAAAGSVNVHLLGGGAARRARLVRKGPASRVDGGLEPACAPRRGHARLAVSRTSAQACLSCSRALRYSTRTSSLPRSIAPAAAAIPRARVPDGMRRALRLDRIDPTTREEPIGDRGRLLLRGPSARLAGGGARGGRADRRLIAQAGIRVIGVY